MLAPVLKICLQVSCLCLCLAYVLHHHHHHHSRHQHHCNDDNDVWRCLASCRCKFCPESSNSGLGQSGRDEVQLLWWWWQWFSYWLNIIGFLFLALKMCTLTPNFIRCWTLHSCLSSTQPSRWSRTRTRSSTWRARWSRASQTSVWTSQGKNFWV